MVGAEVVLNIKSLRQKLLQGALEKTEAIVSLPLPNGEEVTFVALESPVMEAELSAQFPDTKSFLVQGIQHPNWKGRVAISPFGLVAVILTADGTLIVEPTDRYNAPSQYRTYFDKEFSPSNAPVACGTQGKADEVTSDALEKSINCLSIGTSLRKYRIAIASSGEFTNGIGGGTLAGTNAIINERLTALNVIYENEIAIHFDLVANNNNIIFFDAVTDGLNPVTSPIDQRPSSAQTVITNGIGSANFDIGHAFYEIPNVGLGFSGSGVAGLGVVCNTSRKAQGWTGTTGNSPLSFVMGVFAHEVAHQLNAAHSFYGTDGFCFPGQRAPGNGYEPGSGTSLMSYSGTCNTHNILPIRATNYFHIHNLVQINNYVNSTTCEATTASGNTPPVVTIPNNFTIPKGTSFELIGSATDAQDINLTYSWEEYDTDNLNLVFPQGSPNDAANSTTAPLFRSFDPSSSGNKRTFPQLSDVVNNTQTLGEILPQVGRTIKMRLTVRDNHAGITGQAINTGGVTCEEISITVNGSAGPFTVTAPNTSVAWATGSNQTISWSVASTNSFCANVNILLSTDGGFTYPFVLASNTPNDGSQSIVVPAGATNTSQARVRVECANPNATFFDISNVNFTINSSCSAGGSRLCPTASVVGTVGAAKPKLGHKTFF
ncbi:MAG: hypothetical protein HC892_13090 [Saprospiraceae bacterium]|nr:hypothetical protein [Saprospiraceae bacterium]